MYNSNTDIWIVCAAMYHHPAASIIYPHPDDDIPPTNRRIYQC